MGQVSMRMPDMSMHTHPAADGEFHMTIPPPDLQLDLFSYPCVCVLLRFQANRGLRGELEKRATPPSSFGMTTLEPSLAEDLEALIQNALFSKKFIRTHFCPTRTAESSLLNASTWLLVALHPREGEQFICLHCPLQSSTWEKSPGKNKKAEGHSTPLIFYN